jgi:serine/threonine-protein kinase
LYRADVHLLPDVEWRRGLDWLRMSAGLLVAAAAVVLVWRLSTAPAALTRTPDMTGMRADVAEASAAEAGLHTKDVRIVHGGAPGTVVLQTPKAGTFLARGSVITVAITTGAKQVGVPQVASMPVDQARDVLARAGLGIGAVIYRSYPDREPGRVVSQSPSAGSRVDEGTSVDLVVPLPPH